ncbi:lipocalin family protein [Zobellia galactanivorans]|uniref:Hypothetical Lipoprotein n=1 Tax=Zobellia galactanivorans (strain DSM 12802 / CCUG 47099 / CIP 106680 / NCIMB 13871 / Dsij) TaxID=63186 RepID=G0L9E7_ZOBGA|nr:lipocalin family protein [Zobellia galactanivorans]CAZ94517.1 hypothetical Lipoprotein [Zobellia galactanivorans]
MKKSLLFTLAFLFLSCSDSDTDSDDDLLNKNAELLVGKWAYSSSRINGVINNQFKHSGEACPGFKPDYIQFTENGRYIQFAFLNCEEEFVVDKLYQLKGDTIYITNEETGNKVFNSTILEVTQSTLILRTEIPDIVLEEGFKKIE